MPHSPPLASPPRADMPTSDASSDDEAFELLESSPAPQPLDFVAAEAAAYKQLQQLRAILNEQRGRGLRPLPMAIADRAAAYDTYDQIVSLSDTAAGLRRLAERLEDALMGRCVDTFEFSVEAARKNARELVSGLNHEIEQEQTLLGAISVLERSPVGARGRSQLEALDHVEATRKYVKHDSTSLMDDGQRLAEGKTAEEDNQERGKQRSVEMQQQQAAVVVQQLQPVITISSAVQRIVDLERRLCNAGFEREKQLRSKNVELQELMERIAENEEVIRVLKEEKENDVKALEESEAKTRADRLYLINKLTQCKKEIAELTEQMETERAQKAEANKIHLEKVDDLEKELAWHRIKVNEEVVELKKTVQMNEEEIKHLKEEVEKLRAKKENNQEIDKEIAEFRKNKQENREQFRKEYLTYRSSYLSSDCDEGCAGFFMLIQLVCSLLSVAFPLWSGTTLVVSTIAAVVAFTICFSSLRLNDNINLILSPVSANLAMEAVIVMSFLSNDMALVPYLHALKTLLLLLSAFAMKRNAEDRAGKLRCFLERASGLGVDGAPEDEDLADHATPPAASAVPAAGGTEDPAATTEPETRRIYVAKNEKTKELGLVVRRTEEGAHVVTTVLPRGPAERNGGAKIGDEIVSMNDVSMKGATLEFAQFMVKESERAVRMEMRASGKNGKTTIGSAYYL